MEIVLNITWAVFSLSLIGFWMSRGVSQSISRRTQLLSLGMAILLLLPVISLSDDLLAMQAAVETDTSVRRAQQVDNQHPSAWPDTFALPSSHQMPALIGPLAMQIPPSGPAPVLPRLVFLNLDSRPPPLA